jgi:cytochrome c oxidase subunit 3
MASSSDQATYYIPHSGWYPIWVAVGSALLLFGLGSWLNDLKAETEPSRALFYTGAVILSVVLFAWFAKVVNENLEGLTSPQLHRSYIWGISWFIFSEVMFFFAFFGALLYARVLSVQWLGGEGAKGFTGEYLWPEFEAVWPVISNPDPAVFENPRGDMASPGLLSWGGYLPFWNTVILLTSSVTVHFAHTAIKNADRTRLLRWLGLTVALGVVAGGRVRARVSGAGPDFVQRDLRLDLLPADRLPWVPRHARHVHALRAAGSCLQGALSTQGLLRLRSVFLVLAFRGRCLGLPVPLRLRILKPLSRRRSGTDATGRCCPSRALPWQSRTGR